MIWIIRFTAINITLKLAQLLFRAIRLWFWHAKDNRYLQKPIRETKAGMGFAGYGQLQLIFAIAVFCREFIPMAPEQFIV